MAEHLRVDGAVAGNAADEALHGAEPAEVDGDIGKRRDGDEDAELVDAEPAGENGEGDKLRRRAEDETAAGSDVGHDHRQQWSVPTRFRHTFRSHPIRLDKSTTAPRVFSDAQRSL